MPSQSKIKDFCQLSQRESQDTCDRQKLSIKTKGNGKKILICAKQILYNRFFLMYNGVVWGLSPYRIIYHTALQ